MNGWVDAWVRDLAPPVRCWSSQQFQKFTQTHGKPEETYEGPAETSGKPTGTHRESKMDAKSPNRDAQSPNRDPATHICQPLHYATGTV